MPIGFRKLGLQSAQGEGGFVVKVDGEHVVYSEGRRVLTLDAEGTWGQDRKYLLQVHVKDFRYWDSPHDEDFIRPEQRDIIIKHIDEVLTFLQIAHAINRE